MFSSDYLIIALIFIGVAAAFWLAARIGWHYAAPILSRIIQWTRSYGTASGTERKDSGARRHPPE